MSRSDLGKSVLADLPIVGNDRLRLPDQPRAGVNRRVNFFYGESLKSEQWRSLRHTTKTGFAHADRSHERVITLKPAFLSKIIGRDPEQRERVKIRVWATRFSPKHSVQIRSNALQKNSWLWLLTATLFSLPQIAISADLALGGDPEMECYATLSGVIARGDFERVSSILDEENYHNSGPVCLDSPGGLWSEGLALMELFYERAIPTAIAAGARCESACAIAFLGGSSRG
jgi:hypothetical protein